MKTVCIVEELMGEGSQLQKLLKQHRVQVPSSETEEGICLHRGNVHLQACINKGICSLCTKKKKTLNSRSSRLHLLSNEATRMLCHAQILLVAINE